MDWVSEIADPERRLALAYAPRDRRQALAALWALDERLGSTVAATREAMLGEIKLAWWRDALETLGADAPRGEPLLDALAKVGRDHALAPAELARLTEGWAALLNPLPFDRDVLIAHGEARGSALFALSAGVLGGGRERAEPAGALWAMVDVAARTGDRVSADLARALARERLADLGRPRWPKALRALGVLAALARHDVKSGGPRAQGAPRRLALAVWSGMTGR